MNERNQQSVELAPGGSQVEQPGNATVFIRIAKYGQSPVELPVPGGSSIGEALQQADISMDEGLEIRKNGAVVNLNDPVVEGDVVVLIPKIAGGSAV